MQAYKVVRAHAGDRDYAVGETRMAVPNDVRHLVPQTLCLIEDPSPPIEVADPSPPIEVADPSPPIEVASADEAGPVVIASDAEKAEAPPLNKMDGAAAGTKSGKTKR